MTVIKGSACFGLIIWMTVASAGIAAENPNASDAKSSFEIIKGLAGDWVVVDPGEDEKGKIAFTYKVVTASNAVLETYHPGRPDEEITVYNMDGGDLVLTHYCSLGPQSRMRAPGQVSGNSISFAFDSVANMKTQSDAHIHNMALTIVDADRIQTVWTMHRDGRTAGDFPFDLARSKE